MSTTQHVNTGDYIVNYYNKYGGHLRDLTDICSSLEQSKDTANRKLFDVADISNDETHYLPVAYSIDRRIVNSESPA